MQQRSSSSYAVAVAAGAALSLPFLWVSERKSERLMTQKMKAEQQVLELRSRPGLEPWQPLTVTWYGPGFDGRITADGTVYNQESPTCASPTMPLGSVVIVRSPYGEMVPLIVTDRMPNPGNPNRLDVSRYAARRLGLLPYGKTQMEVATVKTGGNS